MGNKTSKLAPKTASKPSAKPRVSKEQKPSTPSYEWIELKRLPQLSSIFQPNPLYFHSTNPEQRYIVFTPGGKACCILYHISKDKYEIIRNEFDNNQEFSKHGHCINEKKKCLYIFNDNSYSQFNLIDKIFMKQRINIQHAVYTELTAGFKFEFPAVLYVKTAMDKIHLFINGRYWTWNDNDNMINLVSQVIDNEPDYCIAFYVNGKLYTIFSSGHNAHNYGEINICDILHDSNKWELCKFRLPREGINLRYDAKVVVVFNCIVILFDFRQHKIWYLDLKRYDVESMESNNKNLWIESKVKCEGNQSQFVVIVNNRFVHSINGYGGGVWDMWHRKIAIDQIIGHDLCAKYDGRLVNGWIREYVECYIPDVIITLVQTYFS